MSPFIPFGLLLLATIVGMVVLTADHRARLRAMSPCERARYEDWRRNDQ